MEDKIVEEIEQMARIIDDRLREANLYIGSMNNGKGYWIAQKLVEHYQSKIPEGSVVLSREEYDKILNKECLRGWIWKEGFNDGKELYSEQLAEMRDTIINLKEELQQARKETAEKILDKVDNESNGQTKQITDLLRKQFGVEVKE